jgi:hypothetical protein
MKTTNPRILALQREVGRLAVKAEDMGEQVLAVALWKALDATTQARTVKEWDQFQNALSKPEPVLDLDALVENANPIDD